MLLPLSEVAWPASELAHIDALTEPADASSLAYAVERHTVRREHFQTDGQWWLQTDE